MKNNKGFSLLEMIIVLAILAVVTSVSFVGLGYVYNTNIKSSIKKVNSSLLKIQSYTTSKSVGGRNVYMRLKKESDGYYIEYWQGEGTAAVQIQEKEKIGKKNLTVTCYYDGGSSGTVTVDSGSPVDIYFDRSTGGLLPVTQGGDTYWSKIEITSNGSSGCSVTISKVTGKTEVTFFQNSAAVTPGP